MAKLLSDKLILIWILVLLTISQWGRERICFVNVVIPAESVLTGDSVAVRQCALNVEYCIAIGARSLIIQKTPPDIISCATESPKRKSHFAFTVTGVDAYVRSPVASAAIYTFRSKKENQFAGQSMGQAISQLRKDLINPSTITRENRTISRNQTLEFLQYLLILLSRENSDRRRWSWSPLQPDGIFREGEL